MIQKKLEVKITNLGKLDLSFWQGQLDELLAYMKEHGYYNDYRKKVYFHARRITALSQEVRIPIFHSWISSFGADIKISEFAV